MDLAPQVQILEEAICISYWERYASIVEQNWFFNVGMATCLGKEKLNSNLLNINLVSHPGYAKVLSKYIL